MKHHALILREWLDSDLAKCLLPRNADPEVMEFFPRAYVHYRRITTSNRNHAEAFHATWLWSLCYYRSIK